MIHLELLQDSVSLTFTGLLALGVLASFPGERENPQPYSKFASDDWKKKQQKRATTANNNETMVPSRLGMFLIYSPSVLVALSMLYYKTNGSLAFSTLWGLAPATVLLAVHFTKRVLEVLLLHVYSGQLALASSVVISVAYSCYTWLIASRELGWMHPNTSDTQIHYGLAFFAIGTLGNFYHHWILASLRRAGNADGPAMREKKKQYVLPVGGLFCYLTTPHYFFELIAWAGIALTAHIWIAALVFLCMSSYLSARALNTRDYYRTKFGKAWPEKRYVLIPFVF